MQPQIHINYLAMAAAVVVSFISAGCGTGRCSAWGAGADAPAYVYGFFSSGSI